MTEACEVQKISLEQKADGILVTFRIQVEHLPENLLLARIPSRFAMALVEIDDNEQPVPPRPSAEKQKKRQNANVMRAAIACGEEKFQTFLRKKYPKQWRGALEHEQIDNKAADALRAILGIESRKALADDENALAAFDRVMAEYEMWKKGE